MFEDVSSFLQRYFVDPIIQGNGYNIYNTAVYAIIFVLMAFGIYKLLKHYKIVIDTYFLIGVTPYIALGGILRVLQDAGITKTYVFVTPLIYFFVLAIALTFLGLAISLQRLKKSPINDYWKTWAMLGAGSCLIALAFLSFRNLLGGGLIIGVFVLWVFLFLGLRHFAKRTRKLLSWENMMVLLAHVFDATTTFVSIQFFPYTEQHVVAGAVIDAIGPIGMYVLKIPVILAVLYLLDKELPTKILTKDYSQERTFIKLAILVLGLGPGIRNALRLVVGV